MGPGFFQRAIWTLLRLTIWDERTTKKKIYG
jgi:hypothetical protein